MKVSERDAQILQVIAKHCDEISEISRLFGNSKDEFMDNYAYQSSCSMLTQTIGEAAKNLSYDFLAKTKEIPWKEIKGMRNIFAHEYDHSLDFEEALINSAPSSWHIFFALSVSTNPPHSLCYASGLSP